MARPGLAGDARAVAAASAQMVGHSLDKVYRWLHEIALPQIDPTTGLYRADGQWNYRDTAADCYPFFVWAAHVVDEDVLGVSGVSGSFGGSFRDRLRNTCVVYSVPLG